MTESSASDPSRAGSADARGRRLRPAASAVALGLAILTLWLIEIVWPAVPGFGLDPSWQAALAQAHDRGWQFGTQVVFSYGPWGYLMQPLWLWDALGARLAWELGGKLLLIAIVGVHVWRFPWRRGAVLGFTAVAAFVFFDAFYNFTIFLLIAGLLAHEKRSQLLPVVTAVALAWLTLMKYTFLVESVLGMGAALAAWVWLGQWRRAAAVGATYGLSLAALWILAGQSPAHFLRYVVNGLEVSRGYEAAMISDTPGRLLAWGIVVAAALLARLALLAWTGDVRGRLLALFAGAVLTMNWKHSFIRAGDDHIRIFFLVAAVVAMGLPWPERRFRWRSGFGWVALGLALGGSFVAYRGWRDIPARMVAKVAESAGRLARLPAYAEQWRGELAAVRAAVDPNLRTVVGRASVDVFNYEQGEIVVAGLDYRPRPTLQGYCAYTPALLEMNRRYYESPAAPDCILIKWQTIDGRFPTLDDAWLLKDFGRRYRLAGAVGRFLVARRRAEAAVAPRREPDVIVRRTMKLGETFSLPADRSCALQMKVIARPTTTARLRALVYKPAGLDLVVVDTEGETHRHRLIADMARDGFVINPLIETQAELAEYFNGRGTRWVASARVEAGPGQAWLWQTVEVEFARLPDQPMRSLSAGETVGLQVRPIGAGTTDGAGWSGPALGAAADGKP